MWRLYAVLSALFAGMTAIFAKLGMKGVDSNLATAVRTVVILFLAWGIVFATGGQDKLSQLTRTNWVYLALSGVVTGLSWIFYFKAIQLGEVSKVAPIDKLSIVITIALSFLILGEAVKVKTLIGGAMIAAGTFVLLL